MPKIKVKPTPAQARILRALDENFGLFIGWNGKGQGAYWTGTNDGQVVRELGAPRASTMRKLQMEGWIEEVEPESEVDRFYKPRYWKLSAAGYVALAPLKDDDFVTPGPDLTAEEILHVLEGDIFPPPYWLFCRELSLDRGRRIDAFVMRVMTGGIGVPGITVQTYLTTWALEVKISRSDFLSELADPWKRQPAMLISHRFAFVTPAGLLKTSEIPEGLGLLEVMPNRRVHLRKRPDLRRPDPPTWKLVASITRSLMRGDL